MVKFRICTILFLLALLEISIFDFKIKSMWNSGFMAGLCYSVFYKFIIDIYNHRKLMNELRNKINELDKI